MKHVKPATYSMLFIYLIIVSFSWNGNIKTQKGNTQERQFENGREVSLKLTYKITVTGRVDKLNLKMMIPGDIKDRQKINSISFSIQPDSIYSLNSNTYALFKFRDIDKSFKIIVKSNLKIYRTINDKNDSAENDLSKYLIAEKNIESNSSKIISVAATLKQKNNVETIIKTFEYVQNNIRYEENTDIGAEKVLETKVGKCMDYSDLFVALLRANNIPAKSMFGMVVDYDGDNPLHAWPEVYLNKQGWIRFDPTTGHSEITSTGKNYSMKISNKYIILSEGRNDPELHLSMYLCTYHCSDSCNIKAKVTFDIDAQ